MVDDIFLTPEEQDERAKKWLRDNGMAIAVGVSLGLTGIFGYNWYQDKLLADAEMASALFGQSLERVQNSDLADISAEVEQLKSDFASTPYAAKAVLLKAKQLAVTDQEAAIAELRWVQENAQELGAIHSARIRQIKLLIAQEKLTEAKQLAAQQPYNGFDSNYHELLGDIAVKESNLETARSEYQLAIDSISENDVGYRTILELKTNRLPKEAVSAEKEPAAASNGTE